MESKNQWEELFRLMRDRDWRGATKSINGIIESDPENPNHYLKKGDICLKAGDGAESLNSYLKAAWYLNRQGFLKKALAVYKMALRSEPDNDEAIRASNKILMELESPVQTSEKMPWTEAFAHEEVLQETAEITPDMENAGAFLQEQLKERAVTPIEEVFEPAHYTEDAPAPAAASGIVVPSGFLSYFTPDEIAEILERAELKRFSDGENVVQEGDTGDSIYLIKSGIASVVGHFFGKVVQLETLSPGDLFGEVAFLTGRTRTANVTSKGELEAYEINRLFLEELIEKRPEILSEINEIYIKRVRDTVRKVKSL